MTHIFTWLWSKIKSSTKSVLDTEDNTAPVNTSAVKTALEDYQVGTWEEKTDGNECFLDYDTINVKRTYHIASSETPNNTPDNTKTWIIESYQSKKSDNTYILNQLAYNESNDILFVLRHIMNTKLLGHLVNGRITDTVQL